MREQKNREKGNDRTFVKILQAVWSAGINVNSMSFEGERLKEKKSSKKKRLTQLTLMSQYCIFNFCLYSNFLIYYTPTYKYLFDCFV